MSATKRLFISYTEHQASYNSFLEHGPELNKHLFKLSDRLLHVVKKVKQFKEKHTFKELSCRTSYNQFLFVDFAF